MDSPNPLTSVEVISAVFANISPTLVASLASILKVLNVPPTSSAASANPSSPTVAVFNTPLIAAKDCATVNPAFENASCASAES